VRAGGDKKDMYAAYGRSMPQRVLVILVVGACVGLAWWVMFGGGMEWVGVWFGRYWRAGDEARRMCIGIALTVYFVRLVFTQFVFLKRAIRWGEALAIAPWILVIYLVFAFSGGSNGTAFGVAGALGCVLFVLGSWMNSYAEYARHTWKQRAENRGQLYTMGLFRFSRHPNYLGDLISFSGLCLIAGRWATVAIPLIMLAGFVFVNIPMLDAHLRDHYGAAFAAYSARTRKLIPMVY
jgi:protein-S-isoprenylcysteine O-methyltransferase Ste14